MVKLYSYWRSTAAYRVRIALNLKEISYETVPVHLVKSGGEHLKADYEKLNPQKFVPTLENEEGEILTQSLAIMEYLEERIPEPSLLPDDPSDRAYVRSLSQMVCCDIHPVNNLRVLKFLTGEMGVSGEQKTQWYQHWIEEGFVAFETRLKKSQKLGEFCFGDNPGMADCCLVSQVYNARRFDIPLEPYPTIQKIEANCLKLDAFDKARPENQPDAEL